MSSNYAKNIRQLLTTLAITFCLPLPCFAQKMPLEHPVSTPVGPIQVSIEGWTRLESRSFADFRSTTGDDPDFRFSRLRLGLGWQTSEKPSRIRIFLQPQETYRQVTGAIPRTGNITGEGGAIHQGYIEERWGKNTLVRLGRQELEYGGARLIAASGWTNCGRSFDAVRVSLTKRTMRMDGFVGRLGEAFNKVNSPILAGIYATDTRSKTRSTDYYLLLKADRINGSGISLYTLGARPKVQYGRWSGTMEVAGQFGQNAGRVVQAWAGYVNGSYNLGGRNALRLGAEYDLASGGNPTDKRHYGTFDQLFPNNHFLYGIADLQGWRNMSDLSTNLRSKVGDRATATFEVHRFRLSDARDYWYADNGAANKGVTGKALRDATGAAGKDIGREIDLYGSFEVSPTVTLSGGVARFLPGSYVRRVNTGNAHPSNWFCFQTNYRF